MDSIQKLLGCFLSVQVFPHPTSACSKSEDDPWRKGDRLSLTSQLLSEVEGTLSGLEHISVDLTSVVVRGNGSPTGLILVECDGMSWTTVVYFLSLWAACSKISLFPRNADVRKALN